MALILVAVVAVPLSAGLVGKFVAQRVSETAGGVAAWGTAIALVVVVALLWRIAARPHPPYPPP